MGQSSSRQTGSPPAERRSRLFTRPLSRDDRTAPDTNANSSRPRSRRYSSLNLLRSTIHSDAGTSESNSNVVRRRSRLNRTLSTSRSLFHRHSTVRYREHPISISEPYPHSPSLRVTQTTSISHDGPSHRNLPFLPPPDVPDLDLTFDGLGPASPAVESEVASSRPNLRRDHPQSISDLQDRLLSNTMSQMRDTPNMRRTSTSRLANSLRRRRSPVRRNDEDQAIMLSRLLSVAAAATAASLMGDDHQAVSEARSVTGDGDDGTFDSFLQSLQSGRIAHALRQGGVDPVDGEDGQGGSSAPLNFFRMFRFGSSSNNRNDGSERASSSSNGNAGSPEDSRDGRLVPIIIVGIRSINPNNGTGDQDTNIPSFLDALSDFPTAISPPGDASIDGILQQPQNGTRFSHRRRASMGGINPFPANYDSQRHHRTPERPRPWSTMSPDTPSGPLPPPSTPASSGLSAFSSGNTTPTFASSSSTPFAQSTAPSRRGSFIRRPAERLDPLDEPQPAQRSPRQRRLSESDFTRFGSGASRRNGMVEPDHTPGEGSRSWIIYVLGGNYPENHPIVTTPSLFTDSPTYEDMLLLSALLGPAKPPVASEADVASAPGLFRIAGTSGTLTAMAVEGDEMIVLGGDDRCLVCLCDFEVEDEARRLVKCGHLFHRECIDQWLTTGRNSCPLCRGQGVDEKSSENATPSTTPPATEQA